MQRRIVIFLALAALGLTSAPQALAQGRGRRSPERDADPSRVLLPGGIGDRTAFEEELVNRLNRARDLAASERLLKKIIEDPDALGLQRETLEKLAGNIANNVLKDPKRFGIDPKDPKWERLAEQLKQNKPPTREQLKALEKIADGFNPSNPDVKALLRKLEARKDLPKLDKADLEATRRVWGPFNPPIQRPGGMPPGGVQPPPPMGDPHNPMPPVPPMPPPGVQPPVPPAPPAGMPPPRSPVRPPAERPDNRNWFSRQLGKLRSSTGLGGEFRGLFRGLFGERTGLGKFGRGLSEETSRLRSKVLPSFGGIRFKGFMGGLGKVVPRNLKLSSGSSEKSSSRTGLSGLSAGGLGSVVLVVLLLAGAGVVLWLVLAGRRWVRGEAGRAWRLGPWPVTPAAVRTRGDVVKAFEYLAMLLLGRRAVPANHREIEGQLALNDLTGQRRLAAAELADLYEHARYAPPDEDLSPDEVASARRDLSVLAGSSAA
jgi:hypothetical protein